MATCIKYFLNDPQELFNKGTEITTDEALVLTPLQQQNEAYLMIYNSTTGIYTLINYVMHAADSYERSSQDLHSKNTSILTAASCKLLFFSKKVSILTGKLHNRIWRLSLYYLDTEAQLATLKHISHLTLSIPDSFLDFENSFVIPYKDDTIIIVSIVNYCMYFHVISKGIYGKKLASTNVSISQLNIRAAPAKFKIQSCIMLSNNIYCSLWQQGVGVRICQFNTWITQQQQRITLSVRLASIWQINDNPTLQSCNCFLSVHKREIVIICCSTTKTKSILEIKRLNFDAKVVFASESRFAFPYMVKIETASVIPQSENLVVTVTYQDRKTDKYYIKTLNMLLYICTESINTDNA